MKKRKPYKLPEIKTKSQGSQIRMASAPQQNSKKVEENGAILSKFWEEIISSYYPLPSQTINQVWRKKRDILNAQGRKKQPGLVGPGFYIILGALFKKEKKKKKEITNTKLGVNVNIFLYWEKKSQQIWTMVVQGFFF